MLQVPYHRAAPQHHDEARRMEPLCETHDAQAELGHQRQPGETDLRIRGLRPDRAERQEPEGLFPRIERRGNREAEEVANRKPPCHALQRNGSGPGVFRPQYPVTRRRTSWRALQIRLPTCWGESVRTPARMPAGAAKSTSRSPFARSNDT